MGNEPFVVILADDFLTNYNNGVTSDLVKNYKKTGKTQLSVMEINGPEISKYGVIVTDKKQKNITGLIEKPKFQDAPSNLASIGRYILTPDIFNILRNQEVGSNGEIQLADAINIQASKNSVETVLLNGKRFDCGSKKDYVEAIKYMSKNFEFD